MKRKRSLCSNAARSGVAACCFFVMAYSAEMWAEIPSIGLTIEQVTSGPKHHFFGYIGQCQTIPWNASGRYILGLEVDAIDRMPEPGEAATVILVDTHENNRILRVEKTHAWNPQQGTMFYWNPLASETQFFFNDRDPRTGKVFTVLLRFDRKWHVCVSIDTMTLLLVMEV